MWENHLCLLLLGSPLVPFLSGVPLEPGQPGAPWTEEEVEVTREKVDLFFLPRRRSDLFFDLIFLVQLPSRCGPCWIATRTVG